MSLKKFLFIFIIMSFFASLNAETVILIHEEVIRGKVKSQDAQTLRMIDETGKERVFQKSEILKVVYRDVTDKKELDKIIKEEKEKKGIAVNKPEVKNKWQIIFRSMVLPGWGQWKAGKKWQAVGCFFAVGAGALYYTSQIAAFYRIEKDYESRSDLLGLSGLFGAFGPYSNNATRIPILFASAYISTEEFKSYNKQEIIANNSIRIAVGIYSLQVFYSILVGREYENQGKPTSINGKSALIDWDIKAHPRAGIGQGEFSRENYYEASTIFRF